MAQKIPQITGDGAPVIWGEPKAWGEFAWGGQSQEGTNSISTSQNKPEVQKQWPLK